MISLEDAQEIHRILIENFGGIHGIRDKGLFESAIYRPYQTFEGQELYPTAIEKAAAILEGIVKNHPFLDGNKRTGYVLARLILMKENIDISASEENKYQFVISVSTSKLNYDQIKDWFKVNTESITK